MAISKRPSEPEDINILKKRYEKLNRDRTVAETNLENAKTNLNALKQKAREEYGTDDVETLRAKLEQMKEENERKRSEYQKSLDQIEQDLQAVETKYRQGIAAQASE
jgi:septal ring factor EnvC (AmiA/AmiB activator)